MYSSNMVETTYPAVGETGSLARLEECKYISWRVIRHTTVGSNHCPVVIKTYFMIRGRKSQNGK